MRKASGKILAQSVVAQILVVGAAWVAGSALSREAALALVAAVSALVLVLSNRRVSALIPQAEDRAEKRSAARIAAQVSHDIRSPLAALELVASAPADSLPEDKRAMLRSAAGRIRDIANELLRKNGERASDRAEGASLQLLSCLIDSLLTEKRLQYRARLGLELESRLDSASYGLFASVDASDLSRRLSELVDRAAQAAGAKARLAIRVRSEGAQHVIEILDGAGTAREELRLEAASAPAWFAPELALERGQLVVSLDDDASTHQIWESRLSGVELLRFSTGAELSRWAAENPAVREKALYLCDYELLGESENGLDVIERLALASRSLLVSSRFAEPGVRERCERLGVRIIPKSIAGYVPVRLIGAQTPALDAILIDDDVLVRAVWTAEAKRVGKRLAAFATADAFLGSCESFDRATAVYVDSNLGSGVRGEEIARRIHELGFSDVHLATGYEPDAFPAMPWIKSIVGKEPAFLQASAKA